MNPTKEKKRDLHESLTESGTVFGDRALLSGYSEISDWQPTVNRLREADVITFPLKNEDVPETTTKLSERLQPQTELEKSISARKWD